MRVGVFCGRRRIFSTRGHLATVDLMQFLWLNCFMKTLVIEANRKNAKGGALVIGTITLFLFCGGLIITFTQNVDWGGPFTWFLSTLIFGWMFATLININIWLWQLSQFHGPLITLSSHGVIDHFADGKYLNWDEIKYVNWEDTSNSGVSILVFKIVPKKRSINYRLLSVFGRMRLHYPVQYLSIPAQEISQFMLDEVPSNILK